MTLPGGRNVVGRVVAEVVADGRGLKQNIKSTLDDEVKDFDLAGDRYGKAMTQGFRRALKDDDPGKAVLESFDATKLQREREGQAFGDDFRRGLISRFGPDLGDQISRIVVERVKNAGLDNVLRNSYDEINRAESEATRIVEREAAARTAAVNNQNRPLSRMRGWLSDIERITGRLSVSNPFPRSRWLRPVGELISLGSKLPELFAKGLGAVTDGFSSVLGAFGGGGGGVGSLFSTIGRFAGQAALSFLSLGASAAALAVVAGVLLTALALLVPLIINLTGVVVALAAAIAAGVIGALGAALPILAALAPAIAVIVLTVLNAKGKLGDAFKEASAPLVTWYQNLHIANTILGAYKDTIAGAVPLLGRVGILLENTATGLRDGFKSITAGINDPAFLNSLETLADPNFGLPAITRQMTEAAGNFFTGLVGLLVPLLGPANSLAGYILLMSQKFTDFTNSAAGQNTLREWFLKAWDSATKLWGVIEQVGNVVFSLLNSGQESGNGLLDRLQRVLQQASDWIKDGGLQRFFADAVAFVTPFATALSQVADYFGKLNTPENQKRLNDFLTWLGEVIPPLITFTAWLIQVGSSFINDFVKPIADFVTTFAQNLKQSIDDIKQWATDFWNGLKAGFDAVWDTIKQWWHDLWQGLVDAVKSIFGIHSPSTVFFDIGVDIVMGLWNGFLSLLGLIGTLPGLILGALSSLGGLLLGWITDAWNTVYGWIAGFIGSLVGLVSGIPGQILGAVGSLAGMLIGWAVGAFGGLVGWISGWIFGSLIPTVAGIPGQIAGALGNIADAIASPFESAASRIKSAFQVSVSSVIPGLQSIIDKAAAANQSNGLVGAGGINVNLGAGLMAGGIIDRPQVYRGHPVGERWLKELVVPLQLPLSKVNPKIRPAAEAARAAYYGTAATGGAQHSSVVNHNYDYGDIHVAAPQTDPLAAAHHIQAFRMAREARV